MALNIEKLKQAKKEKGFSYDDLARITGYSRSTITNIFCGYIDLPRHDTVQAIEAALGLNQSTLEWTADDQAEGIQPNYREKLSPDEVEFLDAYRALKSEKGDRAAHAVKTIIKAFLDGK